MPTHADICIAVQAAIEARMPSAILAVGADPTTVRYAIVVANQPHDEALLVGASFPGYSPDAMVRRAFGHALRLARIPCRQPTAQELRHHVPQLLPDIEHASVVSYAWARRIAHVAALSTLEVRS